MGRRWRWRATGPVGTGAVLLLLALLPACGATAGRAGSPAPTAVPTGADHRCVVPGSGPPRVDWAGMANPILSYPDAGAKDQALVWTGGRWHMLFSYMTMDPADPGGVRWNVATATSANLARWSKASPWPAQAGAVGVASPDVVQEPSGRFVVTYQSNAGPSTATQDKLFYRTSTDLVHFSSPHPLARSLAPAPGDRQIDPALAYTGHGLILGFKAGGGPVAQRFQLAVSPSGSLAGPWHLLGAPAITVDGGTVENYEFLTVGGQWYLVATSNNLDQPWLFRLQGNPSTPRGWLRWSPGRRLLVPSQAWDSGPGISSIGFEQANSAFLCNARTPSGGGYVYLLYAGSRELTRFGGWGHASIGIARSTDLVHWTLPPGGGGAGGISRSP